MPGPIVMQIKIIADFAFGHRGVEIKQYTAGTTVDADDPDLVRVALAEGWAQAVGAAPEQAMRAPEDKDAARQRRPRGKQAD